MSMQGLSTAATQLLGRFQKQTSPISKDVEQKINDAAKANEGKPLSAEQLGQVLLTAMPEQKSKWDSCKKSCVGSGENTSFLTQILDHRIEKETQVLHIQPAITVRRDPLYATFSMDPKATAMLLFNARDVDENGSPLLMKVVCREGADASALDLSQYRTKSETPDVVIVGKTADFVEIKEVNEEEFAFGDPLLQVSTNAKGGEISRSVNVRPTNTNVIRRFNPKAGTTNVIDPNSPVGGAQNVSNPNLDREPVVTFENRLHVDLKAKTELEEGAWLDTKAANYNIALGVDRGLMFEPDSNARVQLLQTTLTTAVPADDADLLGSAPQSAAVVLHPSYVPSWTLATLLGQNVALTTSTGGGSADAVSKNIPLRNLLYPNADQFEIAGAALRPAGDIAFKKDTMAAAGIHAVKVPLADDAEHDGQRICIELDKGFIKASGDASVKGFTIVAGYADQTGKWHPSDRVKVSNDKNSPALSVHVDVPQAKDAMKYNRNIELRVFNAEGLPAERVTVPIREIDWSEAVV